MDYTYLILRGWTAYRATIGTDSGTFVHNPGLAIIVNKQGVLYNEHGVVIPPGYEHIVHVIDYSEVADGILDRALEVESNRIN